MDPSVEETSDDIQTDAEVVTDENLPFNSQSATVALPACGIYLQPSASTSGALNLLYTQTARPVTSEHDDVDDNEYMKYLSHMPPELQEDNIDILIINAENDIEEAASFQKHLIKDILFYIHDQPRRPRVKRLDEIRYGSMDHLDLAFTKSLYVFLYVTQEFCAEPWTLLQGQACLTEAIHDNNKKWCVVPIHTTPRKQQRYKLPMMLNSLRPINYWRGGKDQFYVEGVRKLLETQTGLILQRERTLDEDRRMYFIKNRLGILKNAQYRNFGHHVAQSTYTSPAVEIPVCARKDSLKQNSSDCSVNTSAVYQNNLSCYSLPDHHSDKAVPEENGEDVGNRTEEVGVSEEQMLPENNPLHIDFRNVTISSTGRENYQVPQQSLHTGMECVRTMTANSDNNNNNVSNNINSNRIGQSAHLTASGLNESVVVDGSEDEGSTSLSTQQNRTFLHTQHNTTLNTNAASVGTGSPAFVGTRYPASVNIMQNLQTQPNAFPQHAAFQMQNQQSYDSSRQRNYILDSMGRFALMPFPYCPVMRSPNFFQNAVPPYDMQGLYTFANPPIPQTFYIPQTVGPHSQGSIPDSFTENQQLSTEVNAPDSVRSSLSHSSSVGASGPVQFFPYTGNSIPVQTQEAYSFGSHRPTTQPVEMARESLAQSMRPQVPVSGEALGTDQFRRERAASATVGTPGAFSGGAGSTASSVVQHIHHHHHGKQIKIRKATNVLIGDQSRFVANHKPMDVVTADDETSSESNDEDDDTTAPAGESSRCHLTRSSDANSRMSRQAPNNSQRCTSNTSRYTTAENRHRREASMGFAECLSPASSRQPVEGSESTNSAEDDADNQTSCKRLTH